MKMNFRFLILFTFILGSFKAVAQPTLPDFAIMSKDAINILSWNNPYTADVRVVYVQRSNDSVTGFYTIGAVPNILQTNQSFVDAHPTVGLNYYLIKVVFESGTEYKSNIVSVNIDSLALANQKSLPPNDTLQKLIASMGTTMPEVDKINALSYNRSRYIYTNPFNGNINIELPDPQRAGYKIVFTDQKDAEVLSINRVIEDFIVLDKRNFNGSGIYKFKVYKGNQIFENGYVTVY